MSTLSGPFTTDDRDYLALAGNSVALLPVPGASDLATRLSCIAQTRLPSRAYLAETLAVATKVRNALLAEASPDRWLAEVEGLSDALDVMGDLIAQRRGQAERVQAATAILEKVSARLPVTA